MPRVFILKLQTDEEGCIRRLRRALKTMLRRDQLRCVSIEETIENRGQDGIPDDLKLEKTDD
jgi:hypothetical protein